MPHHWKPAEEPQRLTAKQYRLDLERFLTSALDALEGLTATEGSRELSLVRTKLEEAEFWFTKATEGDA